MKKWEYKYALMKKGYKLKTKIANVLYDVGWEAPHYSKLKRLYVHSDEPEVAEKIARHELRGKLKDKWTGFRILSREIIDDVSIQ